MKELRSHQRFALLSVALVLVLGLAAGVAFAGEQPKTAPAPAAGLRRHGDLRHLPR